MSRARQWLGWVVALGACRPSAPPPPPPRPPIVEPAPAPAPAGPPEKRAWRAPVDPETVAEHERIHDSCKGTVAAYNDLDDRNSAEFDASAPGLLSEAARCFEKAGHMPETIRILKHLRELYPERAEIEDFAYRMRIAYRTMGRPLLGSETLVGRACGATTFDPPPEARPSALMPVAECLEQAGLVGAALRYRTMASERGAEELNAESIERLERLMTLIEDKMLEP